MHILPWRRTAARRVASVAESLTSEPPRRERLTPFKTFALRTSCGGVLRARATDGEIVNEGPQESSGAGLLLLLRLPVLPMAGFLVEASPVPRPIGFAADSLRAPVISVVLPRFGATDQVALRHPLIERHVCAIPHGEGRPGAARMDRAPIGGWEVHTLEPIPDLAVLSPAVMMAMSSTVGPLLAGLSVGSLTAWFEAAVEEEIEFVGAALLRLARPAVIAEIGALLLERPGFAERLARALPADDPVVPSLPGLAAWSRLRDRRPMIHLSPALDKLAERFAPGQPCPDIGVRLAAAARSAIRPRLGAAIVSSCRNEGIHLLDWIAYHRAIGFEHVYLYSNDNDDGSDALLGRLAEHGLVTWLPNGVEPGGVVAQRKALNHAFLHLPELLDHGWAAVIDIDEYVTLDPARFRHVGELLELAERRGADAVALNGLMFGSAGWLNCPDEPMAAKLLARTTDPAPRVKTITRANAAWGATPYAPLWPDTAARSTVDADGAVFHCQGRPFGESEFRHVGDPGPAWIAHFHLKSLPEFVWKASRNRGGEAVRTELRFAGGALVGDFLARFDPPDAVHDERAWQGCARFEEERSRLAALPGIAQAHGACVAIFRQTTLELMRGTLDDPSEVPVEHRAQFLALLEAGLRSFG